MPPERGFMEDICSQYNLLEANEGVIRIPFMVKGRIISPPAISSEQVKAAFEEAGDEVSYLKMPDMQLIREPVIDSNSMRYNGAFFYKVLPSVDGIKLIETDTDKLAQGLYALPVEDILDYLGSILSTLVKNPALLKKVYRLYHLTAEEPGIFLDDCFHSLKTAFDPAAARLMIDRELSFWGVPGGEFLNEWVKLPPPAETLVRAMPTRQLHITAGNALEVPLISALRAVLTKSAAVIKCPSAAVLSGALLALTAATAEPEHPITKNLSIVYWQGGDKGIENTLFAPGAFDRIVVWGSPETVASVQSRALYSRIICLNPRYGVSLIGEEAFSNDLREVAARACADTIIHNQKACTSSLVHYVEGTEEQVRLYAGLLQQELAGWDDRAPQFISPSARGSVKRMQRGRYSLADWYINRRDGEFSSGVVVAQGEFDILDHPMCRLIVVRRVDDLADAAKYLHPGVSTAGIYPEERRLLIRDVVAARGVSSILPLGQCNSIFAGMPHDGMVVLNQLVDWKVA